eukprot:4223-Heterococcus_DN1.PRE.3
MELSKALREASKLITGKQQLIVASVAKALEIVPRQLRCVQRAAFTAVSHSVTSVQECMITQIVVTVMQDVAVNMC